MFYLHYMLEDAGTGRVVRQESEQGVGIEETEV